MRTVWVHVVIFTVSVRFRLRKMRSPPSFGRTCLPSPHATCPTWPGRLAWRSQVRTMGVFKKKRYPAMYMYMLCTYIYIKTTFCDWPWPLPFSSCCIRNIFDRFCLPLQLDGRTNDSGTVPCTCASACNSIIINCFQLSATILGVLSGPILGLYLVGAMLPFVGGVVSSHRCPFRGTCMYIISSRACFRAPCLPLSVQPLCWASSVSATCWSVTPGRSCQALMTIARLYRLPKTKLWRQAFCSMILQRLHCTTQQTLCKGNYLLQFYAIQC